MKRILILLLLLPIAIASAQEYIPKNDGVKTPENGYVAFTGAKIFMAPGQVIDDGTLLIHKGKVAQVGKQVNIPENSAVIDLKGLSVYPSFIDVYSDFGIDLPESDKDGSRSAQYDSKREGYYWNEHVMPETDATSKFKYSKVKAEAYLKQGFGVVNTHVQDGIVRGTGMLVALNNSGNDNKRILESNSGQYLSFRKSKYHNQSYPTSLMGSMALLRQLYSDLDWYSKGNIKTTDISLEALKENRPLVQIFDAGNKGNVLRANQIGEAFGIDYVLLGGGDEYELVEQIKNTQSSLILPLNFPKAFDVEDVHTSQYLSLAEMRAWNQAPSNPAVLKKNEIDFALTLHGLKDFKDFHTNVRKAIQYGLSEEDALASLTTIPAGILKKSDQVGSLKQGALANFFICDGNVFAKDRRILEHWVQGEPHRIESLDSPDLNGKYELTIGGDAYDLAISGAPSHRSSAVKKDGNSLGSKLTIKDNSLQLFIESDSVSKKYIRLSSQLGRNKNLAGMAIFPDGSKKDWAARWVNPGSSKSKEETIYPLVPVTYPNVAYGFAELPEAEDVLFKGATVWTNEAEGILEATDVLVRDGKISKVGKDLKAGRARVIDAHGKHLTTGIIDEHSHIATLSTNEAGQNSTAEVSMEDAVNHEDVNIYRNLAGGVTQVQILHGSANPIGGRSAIVKLKWGRPVDEMIDKKAPGFIKFALGENVKQSNWSSNSRFPQTRMGVEQVYVDYFQRAKEYDLNRKSGVEQRRDHDLEVLAEILNQERFISCHSYVQSEINMLMKVAEHFDFKVNTFTHILEGYKVADKMSRHGAGGSTFSDWWAYKYEVNDAIPYNAAIMHSQGVVTAINSDDAEMSRRLNQEAAKTIKYGGVSEQDAWKFVTLNPAKLLHIDDRLGSIKVGKEADLVLWSDHPLSVRAKAEKTMIEGVFYFDLEKDLQMRKNIEKEKNELVNMMLSEKINGKPTTAPKTKSSRLNHCDTVDY